MSSPIINDKKDYVIKVNPRPAFHFHAEFSNKATFAKLSLFTLHLKVKKLSTNSPRDFNSVLDTINHY